MTVGLVPGGLFFYKKKDSIPFRVELVVRKYNTMVETKEKIYNIESDDTGKLWDLRTVKDMTVPFRVRDLEGNDLAQDVYKVKRFPFVYGMKKLGTNDIVNQISQNDGILQDEDGYFLFSEELLKECGIGFILASWLKLDDDGKIKVVFKKSYLGNWYDEVDDVEYKGEKIYSWNDFINSPYKIVGDSHVEYVYGFDFLQAQDLAIANSPNTEHCIMKKMLFSWSNCSYGNKCDPDLVTNDEWGDVLFSRRFPGVELKYILNEDCEETGGIGMTYVTPGTTFIYPKVEHIDGDYVSAYNSDTYAFAIFNLPTGEGASFDDIRDGLNPVEYGVMAEFVETDGETLVYNHSGENVTPNSYGDLPVTDYVDVNSLIVSTDQNGDTDIALVEKYTLITAYMEDVMPVGVIPGTVKSSYKEVKKYVYENHVYHAIEKTYTAEPSVEETLADRLNDTDTKWMTPSEYYSSSYVAATNTNIENPFDGVSESLDWFWVDTIRNWCMYEMGDNGCLYLMCWNGRDGWDRLDSIMDLKNSLNLQTLAEQYLYSQYFFAEGPTIQFDIYNPIRMPNGKINTYCYRTLYLTRDTVNKNYNDKFQSLHDTKIYQTGERYEVSNTGLGVEGKKTLSKKEIVVDSTRPACFGVQNQYCPLVVKLANGNFGLYFVYRVNGNGFGVTSSDVEPSSIMSASDANARCKDIFGSGDDRTIYTDWKRFSIANTDEENATDIVSDVNETLYGATSISLDVASDSLNGISLVANRPNPTTKSVDAQDYMEKWDRL